MAALEKTKMVAIVDDDDLMAQRATRPAESGWHAGTGVCVGGGIP